MFMYAYVRMCSRLHVYEPYVYKPYVYAPYEPV